MKFADRLRPLQRNVFADMDRAKARVQAQGLSLIDLSLGSSDLPTPKPILETIAECLPDRSTHGYVLHRNTQGFRRAAAQWYEQKFGLAVDPETEVLLLIGSQEGTAHLPLAVLNPGDYALLMDPGYPSHVGGVYLANGQVYPMPLLAEHHFLPQFESIPATVLAQARLMILSYPHNPTTAIAPLAFFETAVDFCRRHDLILVHDFPYTDLAFGDPPPSLLQADPQKTCSVELFSLSKSYNMGGFRVGYAIGNAEIIQALRQVKAAIDFNQYQGILAGGITALTGDQSSVAQMRETFQQRRDFFIEALDRCGWVVSLPPATMYIWAPLPPPWQARSMDFALNLVEQTGVAVSPGIGFGEAGEGYVRFALVHDRPVLEEAVARIQGFLQRGE
ncbi:MAG: LL-diaminopimelate aminotransferase [Prochlorotrichaceae cyanobacterium]|jgi:aspartate/methionine/tyrosine aminotransferase